MLAQVTDPNIITKDHRYNRLIDGSENTTPNIFPYNDQLQKELDNTGLSLSLAGVKDESIKKEIQTLNKNLQEIHDELNTGIKKIQLPKHTKKHPLDQASFSKVRKQLIGFNNALKDTLRIKTKLSGKNPRNVDLLKQQIALVGDHLPSGIILHEEIANNDKQRAAVKNHYKKKLKHKLKAFEEGMKEYREVKKRLGKKKGEKEERKLGSYFGCVKKKDDEKKKSVNDFLKKVREKVRKKAKEKAKETKETEEKAKETKEKETKEAGKKLYGLFESGNFEEIKKLYEQEYSNHFKSFDNYDKLNLVRYIKEQYNENSILSKDMYNFREIIPHVKNSIFERKIISKTVFDTNNNINNNLVKDILSEVADLYGKRWRKIFREINENSDELVQAMDMNFSSDYQEKIKYLTKKAEIKTDSLVLPSTSIVWNTELKTNEFNSGIVNDEKNNIKEALQKLCSETFLKQYFQRKKNNKNEELEKIIKYINEISKCTYVYLEQNIYKTPVMQKDLFEKIRKVVHKEEECGELTKEELYLDKQIKKNVSSIFSNIKKKRFTTRYGIDIYKGSQGPHVIARVALIEMLENEYRSICGKKTEKDSSFLEELLQKIINVENKANNNIELFKKINTIRKDKKEITEEEESSLNTFYEAEVNFEKIKSMKKSFQDNKEQLKNFINNKKVEAKFSVCNQLMENILPYEMKLNDLHPFGTSFMPANTEDSLGKGEGQILSYCTEYIKKTVKDIRKDHLKSPLLIDEMKNKVQNIIDENLTSQVLYKFGLLSENEKKNITFSSYEPNKNLDKCLNLVDANASYLPKYLREEIINQQYKDWLKSNINAYLTPIYTDTISEVMQEGKRSSKEFGGMKEESKIKKIKDELKK